MINLKDESDVQIWCDFQEEKQQTNANFFLRLRFSNFRTFLATVANYDDGDGFCGNGNGWGDGNGFGDGDGYSSSYGWGSGSGYGWGYGWGDGYGYGDDGFSNGGGFGNGESTS